MTELKRSLDRALSGVEFRPEIRRCVRLAVFSEQKAAHAVRRETLVAKQSRTKTMKRDASATRGRVPPSGMSEVPQTRRRLSAALVVALIAVLILMAVAVAAVVTRGFGWYATRIDDPVAKYKLDQLEQRAENIVAEQTVLLEKGALRFTVSQGYYDGTRADVTFSLTMPDRSADTAWRPSAEGLSGMEKLLEGNDLAVSEGFDGIDEILHRDFVAQGACGVHIHNYYIGDGVWLPDGQRLVWVDSDMDWQGDVMTGYRSFEPLPQEAKDKPSVQLIFRVKEFDLFYYKDETGVYYNQKAGRTIDLDPITVLRGKGSTQDYRGMSDFGRYATWAEAAVSPVDVKAKVWMRLPDEWVMADSWTRGEDLQGVDYVKDYHLIADGVQLEGWMISEGSGIDAIKGEGFSGEKARFPEVFAEDDPAKLYSYEYRYRGVPEGAKEIRLRPVYSISGEHPEEDVVLEIPG